MNRLHLNGLSGNGVAMNDLRGLRLFSSRAIVLVVAILLSFNGICFGQKKQKLEKNYRDWLERDVAYIITKDERDAFLKLNTDEAREKFIETFWEIRNPSPGSPTNSYKDEIYQRIAFADARFGIGSGVEGWRTDRGRTYITLGPPQQKQVLRNSANLFPIEIWFDGGAPDPQFRRAGSGANFAVSLARRTGRRDHGNRELAIRHLVGQHQESRQSAFESRRYPPAKKQPRSRYVTAGPRGPQSRHRYLPGS